MSKQTKTELIQCIRQSKDPQKVLQMAADTITRVISGESWESICKDYGIDPEEVKKRTWTPC